jgi:protein-tyrosine phosphatase
MATALIVVVGGSDTGRAPMAAALLGRMLQARGLTAQVASAGVLGHDGASAQPEARDALAALGLDLGGHTARSLDDALLGEATLLLAVDSGTRRVLAARLSDDARLASLAELAGVARDIPDPFRMQVGVWLTYAREIEGMLDAALPQIAARAGLLSSQTARPSDATPAPDLVATSARLLAALGEWGMLFDWGRVRQQLTDAVEREATGPLGPAYAALFKALLDLTPTHPSAGQLAALQAAAARLTDPTQSDIGALSGQIGRWHEL